MAMEKELLVEEVLITAYYNTEAEGFLNKSRFYLDQVFRCLY